MEPRNYEALKEDDDFKVLELQNAHAYSGRIAQRTKGQSDEHIIAQLDEEIYSLAYSEKRDEIIVATLQSGVVILNAKTGIIVKSLEVDKWCISIFLSDDENYLMGIDVNGKNYIWDISKKYQLIEYPRSFPKSYVRVIDNSGIIYLSGEGKVVLWNPEKDLIEKELSVAGVLVDVDNSGDLLLLSHNEFTKYNAKNNSIEFKRKHPNWPYVLASGDTAYIPPQMKLTAARFANNKIYTAGIDRSIRVWDKQEGKLLDDWLGHKATINSIDISDDSKQLVSVDLKGGIKFWDIK